jgi:hypothetical protein
MSKVIDRGVIDRAAATAATRSRMKQIEFVIEHNGASGKSCQVK